MLVRSFRLPDGRTADFDVMHSGDYVTVAAFTPQNEAILVKQYRPGPECFLTSFVEGAVDSGESQIEAARRELLEETGFEAGHIIPLKTFRSAYTTQHQYCLLATNCTLKGEQQLDASEFIDVHTMPLSELKAYLKDPNQTDFTNVDCAFLALAQMGLL